jgi:hypothetical protein
MFNTVRTDWCATGTAIGQLDWAVAKRYTRGLPIRRTFIAKDWRVTRYDERMFLTAEILTRFIYCV